MSAGELDGDAPPRPFRGFSSNADDTPRELDHEPVYDDGFDGAEPEPEFNAFEPAYGELTFVPREVWDEASPGPRRFSGTIAAVLAVALAAGAGFMLTRGGWDLKAPQQQVAAPTPRPEAAQPTVGMNVDVAAARETPPAASSPPEPPRTARRAAVARSSPAPVRTAEVPLPRFVDPDVSADASASSPAPAAVAVPVAPPAPIRPSFDCQGARSSAQRMVCSDPRLAAADRRMSRAYAAALAAGGSGDQLRSEQSDWLEIREDAARYSSRAVLNIYEQRTRELEAMTEERPE